MSKELKLQNEPFDNPVYMLNSHCIWLSNQLKDNLLGKILTIIDSSIQDDRQNKAIKDLIKQTVWNNNSVVNDYSDLISQFINEYCKELIPNLKDIETDAHPCRKFFSKK